MRVRDKEIGDKGEVENVGTYGLFVWTENIFRKFWCLAAKKIGKIFSRGKSFTQSGVK